MNNVTPATFAEHLERVRQLETCVERYDSEALRSVLAALDKRTAALAVCAVPLEALHASIEWELHPHVKREIAAAVAVAREALQLPLSN